MTYTIGFGRHQFLVGYNRKRGRPEKSLTQKLQTGFAQLAKAAGDKRCSGSFLSKLCRHFFANKGSKRVFGLNFMAVAVFAGVLIPPTSALNVISDTEITNISPAIIQLTTEDSVRLPVQSLKVTQGYHLFHQAVDLAEPEGSPVYPIMDGQVEKTLYDSFAYGNHLVVNHGSGFKSLYAHLAKITVQEGQEVDKNMIIGTVGATGWATGPHLHLEVYDNGRPFNPLTILK